MARAEGLADRARPEVLFVCVRKAGRSQMAAALTSHLSGGRVGARSAGSAPAGEVTLRWRRAMAEIGLHLEDCFPKRLTDEVMRVRRRRGDDGLR